MGRTAFICVSSWRLSSPVTGTTALTVVSCVASRNKRAPTGCFNSCVYPTLHLILRLDAREERQLSTRKRRVAGRPWAGVRPARFFKPQLQRPILYCSSSARPPRVAKASPSPRTAIPHGIALFALDLQQFAASGEQQRAPTSCSPPPAGAADCATQRVAGAQHGSAQSTTLISCIRPVAHPPERQSRWATRPAVRRTALLALGPKPVKRFSPIHRLNPNPMLGPARRENRLRFSRPKNRHNPKHSPVLRPVPASLRLRFRSAAFSPALRDSFYFGSPPK